jgi:CHAD domain-containing protein
MHVARQLLLRRLQAVYRYLPLVERFSADDMEFVHQLRVQCRRAEAALEMFRDWLPKSRFQSWRRRLRRYRRAATTARELDVMLASFDLPRDQSVTDRRSPPRPSGRHRKKRLQSAPSLKLTLFRFCVANVLRRNKNWRRRSLANQPIDTNAS